VVAFEVMARTLKSMVLSLAVMEGHLESEGALKVRRSSLSSSLFVDVVIVVVARWSGCTLCRWHVALWRMRLQLLAGWL